VIAFSKSFHGRTSLAVSVTDNPSIVAPVNQTQNVIFLPFNDEASLEACFVEQGNEISSVIIEGIQGVGGINPARPEFLRSIRTLCDQYGAVYIADSVQCGTAEPVSFSHTILPALTPTSIPWPRAWVMDFQLPVLLSIRKFPRNTLCWAPLLVAITSLAQCIGSIGSDRVREIDG
jgi:hypothetical protein